MDQLVQRAEISRKTLVKILLYLNFARFFLEHPLNGLFFVV